MSKIIWCNHGWIPCYYGFCPDEKAWHAGLKFHAMQEDEYPHPVGACTSLFQSVKFGKKRVAIITVGYGHAPHVIVNLLVHEAMHVWRDMRDAIGESAPSSEFEAYAMQNITAELFAAYEKTRGPLFLKKISRRP